MYGTADFGGLDRAKREAFIADLVRHFNAPDLNLDCEIDPDRLWDLWAATHCALRRTARALFPAREPGYVRATNLLGHYACNKSIAMRERLAGRIQAACTYEQICESIYSRLPESVRW